MSKILVAYFSASGETAVWPRRWPGCHRRRSLRNSSPDGLHCSRSGLEQRQKPQQRGDERPQEPPGMAEPPRLAGYDTVFVGFPIWWYQAPRIIQTFLESADFSGKTVIPFATSGGSGMGKTVELLRSSCAPDTRWNEGKRLSSHASAQEVSAWTKSPPL